MDGQTHMMNIVQTQESCNYNSLASTLEVLKLDEALTGFCGSGGKGVYFRGTWQQSPNVQGNSGIKSILGNREHKKTNVRFWGNMPIYFRGTREQVPPPPTGPY